MTEEITEQRVVDFVVTHHRCAGILHQEQFPCAVFDVANAVFDDLRTQIEQPEIATHHIGVEVIKKNHLMIGPVLVTLGLYYIPAASQVPEDRPLNDLANYELDLSFRLPSDQYVHPDLAISDDIDRHLLIFSEDDADDVINVIEPDFITVCLERINPEFRIMKQQVLIIIHWAFAHFFNWVQGGDNRIGRIDWDTLTFEYRIEQF